MPKGPNGQKRPADAIGLAVMVGKIATGEIEDNEKPTEAKQKSRALAGQRGGVVRAQALNPKRRAEIATAAAKARWKSEKPEKASTD